MTPVSVRALAQRLLRAGPCGLGQGRIRPGTQGLDLGGDDRADREADHDLTAGGSHPLILSDDGREGRGEPGDGAVDLVRTRAATPPSGRLQGQHDPRFENKLIDVVGLNPNPPTRAVVLCMDENSQIQALDGTQASLPMVKAEPAR